MQEEQERGVAFGRSAGPSDPSQSALSRPSAAAANAWEHFRDAAYFDMWCVRRAGSRSFGDGFHVATETEAKRLAEFIGEMAAALEGCIEHLEWSTAHGRRAYEAACAASAMSAFGQDPKGLEAKPASAVPKADAQPLPGV